MLSDYRHVEVMLIHSVSSEMTKMILLIPTQCDFMEYILEHISRYLPDWRLQGTVRVWWHKDIDNYTVADYEQQAAANQGQDKPQRTSWR
jgi:hypothetical protein